MDLSRLKDIEKFDEGLADAVLRSNNSDVFLLAIARSDCPSGLLIDLSQARNVEVRRGVAAHANTPELTLRRMSEDRDPAVARMAGERVK